LPIPGGCCCAHRSFHFCRQRGHVVRACILIPNVLLLGLQEVEKTNRVVRTHQHVATVTVQTLILPVDPPPYRYSQYERIHSTHRYRAGQSGKRIEVGAERCMDGM
jgi:hypothetical protein